MAKTALGSSNTTGSVLSSTGSSTTLSAAPAAPPPPSSPGSAPTKPATGFRLKVQQLLAGVTAALPATAQLVTPKGLLTKATVIADLDGALSDFATVDQLAVALAGARAAQKAKVAADKLTYATVRDAVVAALGRNNVLLVQFGLRPGGSRKARTSAQKVAAAAKNAATRELRGTTSKKQKAAIQFSGTVAVSTKLGAGQSSGFGGCTGGRSSGGGSAGGRARRAVHDSGAGGFTAG